MRRRGEHGRGHLRPRRPGAHAADAGAGAGDLHVLAGRHPAARRVLRQALHLHRRRSTPGSMALAVHRRPGQRGRRLLLPAHRQGDVFRRAGDGVRPAGRRREARRGCRVGRPGHGCSSPAARSRSAAAPRPRPASCSA